MAVLVEGISVIVRVDRLPPFGTWEKFKEIVPNKTLCADNELVRVGFMSPLEVREFINILRSHGLRYSETGPAEDIVICDQKSGFTTECNWAEFGVFNFEGDQSKPTAAARLVGSKLQTTVTPVGWTWDVSLTREFTFIRSVKTQSSSASEYACGKTTGISEDSPHGWGIQVEGND